MNNIINALIRPDGSVNSCVLVTIITRKGSAPRSSGSRMVVYPDRSISGTIGGGKLEAEVLTAAVDLMMSKLKTQRSFVREFHFSGADAASMDMICGGEVSILFERIDPEDQNKKEILSQIKNITERKEPGWFVLEYNSSNNDVAWELITHLSTWGKTSLTSDIVRQVQNFQSIVFGETISIVERLDRGGKVLIFGAGHVAQPIARLCSMVDFATTVIDDRGEYANVDRFPTTDHIIVPLNINAVFSELTVDESCYIVIVTRGHLQDHIIVDWALTTKAGYIGMIGSRRKWQLLRSALKQKGFDEEDIKRVHTPIGVDIGAETPEEIGISILAELIRVRAGRK